MKKIFSFMLAAAMGCAAVFAQYCPDSQGRTFKFSATNADGKVADEYTSVVESVEKNADGVLSVRIKETHMNPESPLDEIVMYNGYRFNPNDTVTTAILIFPDDFKDMLLQMIKAGAEAAGQFVSDKDMEALAESTKVKGELTLPLTPNAVADQPFEKATMRTTILGQNMIMRITKGMYLGTETIETPAGKFDCLKMSYVMKNTGMGNAPDAYITDWYAPGIGPVRRVQTDKKGKVESTDQLIEMQ